MRPRYRFSPVPGFGRTGLWATLLVLLAAVLSSCGGAQSTGDDDVDRPRPLTTEEAGQLALVRFNLYRESPVRVAMSWPGSPPATYDIELDLREHVAYGTFETDGDEATRRSGFAAWNLQTVATAPRPAGEKTDQAPELGAWTTRSLSTGFPNDIFLALALNLGSDRPENPALLQQSSARVLREDEIDGIAVTVIEGPQQASGSAAPTAGQAQQGGGRTRYWIDGEGRLLRFEAYLGQADGTLARIDIVDRDPIDPALASGAREVLSYGRG